MTSGSGGSTRLPVEDRLADWMREATIGEAPDRLIDSIMAEVGAHPRRRWSLPRVGDGFARRSWSAMAVALVLIVGVGIGVVLSGLISRGPYVGAPSPSPPTSPSPTAGPSASVAGQPRPSVGADLPSRPVESSFDVKGTALAVAGEALWIADANDRVARKVDPTTGRVDQTVPLQHQPASLLAAAGSLWVSMADGTELVRLDPATGSTIATIQAGPGRLAADETGIWLASTNDLMRIDSSTNTVGASIKLERRDPTFGVALGFGAAWVGSEQRISRIDTTSGTVVATIPGDARRLAATAEAMWAIRGTELIRIDPTTNIPKAVPIGVSLSDITVSGSRLWLLGPPAGAGPAYLLEIDPGTEQALSRTPVGPGAVSLTAGLGSIWASTDEPPKVARVSSP
jgi:hypothetical protein